ncbi:MAG TPA: RNA polymerase sigma factor [Saprospiraceae bacterium]|nr:RNA polymerase sigma factor [Saprospiraceae bacterium]
MNTDNFYEQFLSLRTPLRSFAYKLTQNTEEAKDLYQETAFRALSNVNKFIPGTNLKAWLLTIMKNSFINNYRKNMKTRTIIDSTDTMFYINSGTSGIQNNAESNIMMEELTSMLEELDISLRIPFEMYYVGHKYQEIADTLNIPLGTIKSHIFYARKELRGKIEKRYQGIKS